MLSSILNILMTLSMMDRRKLFSSLLTSSIILKDDDRIAINSSADKAPWTLTLPLEPSSGGTNAIRMTVSYKPATALFGSKTYIPKKIFKVIVDTGSPYLVLDGMEYASFLEEADKSREEPISTIFFLEALTSLFEGNIPYSLGESRYGPTEEIYGSQKGMIEWKETFIQVRDNHLSRNTVVGLLDKDLMREAGGSLLGLVKRSNIQSEKIQLRPTFLEQQKTGEEITSFRIDSPNGLLTMTSGSSLISNDAKSSDVIPLVDLRPIGDFVEHYACLVEEFRLDGDVFTPANLFRRSNGPMRKIVGVFDSGLTGCLFTQPLWDMLQQRGINLRDVSSIDVGVQTEDSRKGIPTIFHFKSEEKMNPYFNLSPISLDWFDDEDTCPHVIVFGQTFLAQGSLTIDIDERRATFATSIDG